VRHPFYRKIVDKYNSVRFHETVPSGSRDFQCGRTEGRTEMTKLKVAFGNFAKAPKKKKEI
jgi:hypothetical protein